MVTNMNPVTAQVKEDRPVDPAVLDELGELLESYGALPDVADARRDPSIPEGAVLSETDMGGIPTRMVKQRSMVRAGKTALPERTPVYRWPTNQIVMAPTAALLQQLSKVNRDGHRVFSRRPWPDAIEPTFVEKEVPTQDGRRMTRRFPNEGAYRQFMRYKHPEIWDEMQREEAKAEHDEEIRANRELAEAILASVEGGRSVHPSAAERPPSTPAIEHLNREGLLALADEFGIDLEDQRSVVKIRAAIEEHLSGGEE